MTEQHFLEVYEPYEYKGQNPMPVSGTCLVRGPNGAWYYLVTLITQFMIDADEVSQLLVLPRYNGDAINCAQESTCTVNIERVLPGVTLNSAKTFSYQDIVHWGVGKIAPQARLQESTH